MNKIKVTYHDKHFPIVLESAPMTIIPDMNSTIFSTIGDLKNSLKNDFFTSRFITRYETRDKLFLVSKGTIWYKDFTSYSPTNQSFKLLTIICFNTDTKKYEALVNDDYLTNTPSHKSLINAFIKRYDLNIRKDIVYVSSYYLSMFKFRVSDQALQKLTHPDNQIKFVKDFKRQQLWKIPV